MQPQQDANVSAQSDTNTGLLGHLDGNSRCDDARISICKIDRTLLSSDDASVSGSLCDVSWRKQR